MAKCRGWLMISDPLLEAGRWLGAGESQGSISGWLCWSPWPEDHVVGLLGGNATCQQVK